jgi:4-amino-4-deoxy-L-arabinose transferase-like glycosyltransferase
MWSRTLYGSGAGLLALTLWCTCPNILAHGQMITPDLGATALGLLGVYTFWLWHRKPDLFRTLLAGYALGLAELTKATWVILYPLFLTLWLTWAWSRRGDAESRPLWREFGQLVLIVVISLLVLKGRLETGLRAVGQCC